MMSSYYEERGKPEQMLTISDELRQVDELTSFLHKKGRFNEAVDSLISSQNNSDGESVTPQSASKYLGEAMDVPVVKPGKKDAEPKEAQSIFSNWEVCDVWVEISDCESEESALHVPQDRYLRVEKKKHQKPRTSKTLQYLSLMSDAPAVHAFPDEDIVDDAPPMCDWWSFCERAEDSMKVGKSRKNVHYRGVYSILYHFCEDNGPETFFATNKTSWDSLRRQNKFLSELQLKGYIYTEPGYVNKDGASWRRQNGLMDEKKRKKSLVSVKNPPEYDRETGMKGKADANLAKVPHEKSLNGLKIAFGDDGIATAVHLYFPYLKG